MSVQDREDIGDIGDEEGFIDKRSSWYENGE